MSLVEFATPKVAKGSGQGRATAESFSWDSTKFKFLIPTQHHLSGRTVRRSLRPGQAPRKRLRGPGEWQTYDVTFHRPIFDDEGKVTRKAKFHVVHNGHVIHDNHELSGGTGWRGSAFHFRIQSMGTRGL